MNVRAYLRVSTTEQSEEGYSVPAQRERLDAFCRSQGWAIADWYVEEGESARAGSLDRPELRRLLQDVERHKTDVVLVWRLDRLTRSVQDLYTLLARFEKHACGFRSATEVFDTTTAIGRLFITLVAALAQWEREQLAERVKLGMAEMVRQGKRPGARRPFGYERTESGLLVPHPTEAPLLRELFRRYVEGHGFRALVAWLNGLGVATPTGKHWAYATVAYVIRNAVYTGHVFWGRRKAYSRWKDRQPGEAGPPSHTPLIDASLFAQAQDTLHRRGQTAPRHTNSPYPLTGLLFCGLCGGPMMGKAHNWRTRRGEPRHMRYYYCMRSGHQALCNAKLIRAEDLERVVVEWVADHADPETMQADFAAWQRHADKPAAVAELQQVKSELAEVERRKRRFLDALESGHLSGRDYAERTAALTERQEALRVRVVELEGQQRHRHPLTAAEFAAGARQLAKVWADATAAERKAVIAALVDRMDAYPGPRVEVTPVPVED